MPHGDHTDYLVGGHLQVIFCPVSECIEQVKSGNLRALAVTPAKRLDVFPDVPTVADFVPGYEASAYFGIGAPRGTAAEIVDRLNREINAGIVDPARQAKLANLGATAVALSPADFGKPIAEETEKWAKVIKFAGIKAE